MEGFVQDIIEITIMFYLWVIMHWTGLSIAIGLGAKNYRNRSFFVWFLFALLVSPIIAGPCLLASRNNAYAITNEQLLSEIISLGRK